MEYILRTRKLSYVKIFLTNLKYLGIFRHSISHWLLLPDLIALIAETTVWPNVFLINVFFALKGSKLFIIIIIIRFLQKYIINGMILILILLIFRSLTAMSLVVPHGVYISQLICFARASSHVND